MDNLHQDTERAERSEAEIAQAVRTAFDTGHDQHAMREEVRRIALEALAHGHVDTAAIGQVIRAVLDGARSAVVRPDAAQREQLAAAVQGLDEALAVAAEAAHLAIREAASQGAAFSRDDLQRATAMLDGIEHQFLDGVREAARSASATAATVLSDVVRHGEASGTAVGARVRAALQPLRTTAGELTTAQIQAATHGLRVTGALFASIAAGCFAALADSLDRPRDPDDGTPR